jgi:chitin synthase
MASKYAESEFDGSEFSDDTASHYESEFEYQEIAPVDIEMGRLPKSRLAEEVVPKPDIPPPPPKVYTAIRKRWVCCTWATTWCFSPFCLSLCGKMKDKGRQMAWREKLTLFIIILLMNSTVLLIIIGTGYIICPKDPRFPSQSPGEISGRFEVDKNAAVYMYGKYFIIPDIVKTHVAAYMPNTAASPEYFRSSVLGKDVSWMFPIQNSAFPDKCRMNIPTGFRLTEDQPANTAWFQHRATGKTEGSFYDALVRSYYGGPVVVELNYLKDIVEKAPQSKRFIIISDTAYDLSPFYDISLNPSQKDAWFLGKYFKDMSDF